MTVPACMTALMINEGGSGVITLSIAVPANGSTIANNSTPEAISGTATSTAGNITSIQWQIDGGSFTAFSFTPAGTVNYSGGNAGQIGAGTHVLSVQATDAAGNTITASATYSIVGSSAPGYSWSPLNVYQGQGSLLAISNAAPSSTVSFTQTQYDITGGPRGTSGPTTLGTTNGSGNFSQTTSANWAALAYSDIVALSVGGSVVATFTFYNISSSPSYTYGPTVAPNGTSITLNVTGAEGNAPMYQVATYSPSGSVVTTPLGSTNSFGNLVYVGTASWGTDTSASVSVHMGLSSGAPTVATFSFTP